jgi:hypothetical protein
LGTSINRDWSGVNARKGLLRRLGRHNSAQSLPVEGSTSRVISSGWLTASTELSGEKAMPSPLGVEP